MAKVGIVMGSDSDLEVMKPAAEILDEFGVAYEVTVCSAHRLPRETAKYAETAIDRGLEVIIAGAGGAAHLPGVIASFTTLPVIGVPIKTSTLSGVDSLYSIVQMPRGIPVATVGINASANAALLTVSILALGDPALRKRLEEFRQEQAEEVKAKDARLKELGIEGYLQTRG
ncbi:MAG: 5-(carboxyamino)imidazole ribonucleotide mutase [Syntrophothermus sp.]|uniref:5-(carboxyamino)imidazole ribonucleotide mutase n=1 Tax=Syntrophothermus sp. TaxID=2736299 RepID=UPI00257A98D0|nr:5-(carboxyamino)imidazole ribonucleotide mutase [Syntrophothermus sp.]NSW82927.1 5-(carboxyamino)imidazole ribonucleotide mutase [Syntrophothermus sp.]